MGKCRVYWMDSIHWIIHWIIHKGREWEREGNMSNKENHCTQVDGIEGWKDPEGSTGPHIPENIPSHIDWSSQ